MDAPVGVFSEARAFRHVDTVCGFGMPRTAGSHANEVLTVGYLLGEVHKMVRLSELPGSPVDIEVDVHKVNGSFDLDFLDGFESIYANITNIALRITPNGSANKDRMPATLLSAHFDAAIGSLGASDDMAAVAVLLESLRALVQSRDHDPPRNALVLLLNGAEENVLQAAHGFVSHGWMDNVHVFLNIEAAGAGMREM